MAADKKDLCFDGKDVCILDKWKVRVGVRIGQSGHLLFTYRNCDSALVPIGEPLKYKCKIVGLIVDSLAKKEGDLVVPNDVIIQYTECLHNTVMKDLCADCGANINTLDDNQRKRIAELTSISMVHSVPELRVSKERAETLGRADEQRRIKDRKLVLLVDLDQTIIHSTNQNVAQDMPNVHHFQLYGPHTQWYHTKFRPHTMEFLKSMSKLFELQICTFGVRRYAHTIAHLLDPKGEFFPKDRILSRDECFDPNLKTANMKSLFPCGDSMVCIIDDREDVWNYAPNLVAVKPYVCFRDTGDINAPERRLKNNLDITDKTEALKEFTKKEVTNEKSDEESNDRINEVIIDKPKEVLVENPIEDMNNKLIDKTDEKSDQKIIDEPIEQSNDRPKEESIEKPIEDLNSVSNEELIDKPKDDINYKINESEVNLNISVKSCVETTDINESVKSEETIDSNSQKTDEISEKTVSEEKSPINEGLIETDSKDTGNDTNDNQKTDQTIETTTSTTDNNCSEDKSVSSEDKSVSNEDKSVSNEDKTVSNEDNTVTKEDKIVSNKDISKKSNDSLEKRSESGSNSSNDIETENKVKDETEKRLDDDNDDYLLYLEEILTRIHSEYYKQYDEKIRYKSADEEIKLPDLKQVVPNVRKCVLRGVNIVFSGVIPTNIPPEKNKFYIIAKSFGANVTPDLVLEGSPKTTHLVASKWGTVKVNKSIKQKNIFIVNPNWLSCCADRWERVDERLYPLEKEMFAIEKERTPKRTAEPKTKKEVINSSVPKLSAVTTYATYDPNTGKRVRPQTQHQNNSSEIQTNKGQTDNQKNPEQSRQIEPHNMLEFSPLSGFSSNDLQSMGKEVDDACSEGSGELSTGNTDSESDIDIESPKEKTAEKRQVVSSSDESNDGECPKGWNKNKKNKRIRLPIEMEELNDSTRDTLDYEIRRNEEEESTDDQSIGSVDEEMALAVEREFLS